MNILQGIVSFAFAAALLAVCARPARADFVKAGDRIAFDANNSTTFSLTEDKNGLVLQSLLAGKPSTLVIVGEKDDSEHANADKVLKMRYGDILYNRLRSAAYSDPNTLWLFGYLGPKAVGAFLIDLENGKCLKTFLGARFSLSPDKKNVAYLRIQSILEYNTVYVNDSMVSPIFLKGGFDALEKTGAQANGGETGRLYDLLAQPQNTIRISEPIVWLDDSTIEYVGALSHEGEIGKGFFEKVSFVAGDITTQTLRIARTGPSGPEVDDYREKAKKVEIH